MCVGNVKMGETDTQTDVESEERERERKREREDGQGFLNGALKLFADQLAKFRDRAEKAL